MGIQEKSLLFVIGLFSWKSGSCDRRFHRYLIVVIDDWITTRCFVLMFG